MILESAILYIKPGLASEFESAFREASRVLLSKKGYIDHELHKCVENRDEYIFLARWRGIKDPIIGFRGHPDYKRWSDALDPFYARPPEIKHYIDIRVDGRDEADQVLKKILLTKGETFTDSEESESED